MIKNPAEHVARKKKKYMKKKKKKNRRKRGLVLQEWPEDAHPPAKHAKRAKLSYKICAAPRTRKGVFVNFDEALWSCVLEFGGYAVTGKLRQTCSAMAFEECVQQMLPTLAQRRCYVYYVAEMMLLVSAMSAGEKMDADTTELFEGTVLRAKRYITNASVNNEGALSTLQARVWQQWHDLRWIEENGGISYSNLHFATQCRCSKRCANARGTLLKKLRGKHVLAVAVRRVLLDLRARGYKLDAMANVPSARERHRAACARRDAAKDARFDNAFVEWRMATQSPMLWPAVFRRMPLTPWNSDVYAIIAGRKLCELRICVSNVLPVRMDTYETVADELTEERETCYMTLMKTNEKITGLRRQIAASEKKRKEALSALRPHKSFLTDVGRDYPLSTHADIKYLQACGDLRRVGTVMYQLGTQTRELLTALNDRKRQLAERKQSNDKIMALLRYKRKVDMLCAFFGTAARNTHMDQGWGKFDGPQYVQEGPSSTRSLETTGNTDTGRYMHARTGSSARMLSFSLFDHRTPAYHREGNGHATAAGGDAGIPSAAVARYMHAAGNLDIPHDATTDDCQRGHTNPWYNKHRLRAFFAYETRAVLLQWCRDYAVLPLSGSKDEIVERLVLRAREGMPRCTCNESATRIQALWRGYAVREVELPSFEVLTDADVFDEVIV